MPIEHRPGGSSSIENTLSTVDLIVHSGGRFDLLFQGLGYGGQLHTSGSEVDLVCDTLMKKPIEKPITIKLKWVDKDLSFIEAPEVILKRQN
jgi:hypothetical protein